MNEIIVSELAIYPVKSMRQVPLDKSKIDMGGLKNDRRWMVVDANGRMITQRQQSRLCLIQPELTNDGLCLRTPGPGDLNVPVPNESATRTVTVWNDSCNVFDAGAEAADWLTKFLQIECRLVYFPDNEVRQVDTTYAEEGDRTAFSDGFPVLVTSTASLDDFNLHMSAPIPMERFRPNIVLSGADAYAEDDWKLLKVGDMKLRIVKPCCRCVIPSINIETAEREREVTQTLVKHRKQDKKVFFGQNAIIEGGGELEKGMVVEVQK